LGGIPFPALLFEAAVDADGMVLLLLFVRGAEPLELAEQVEVFGDLALETGFVAVEAVEFLLLVFEGHGAGHGGCGFGSLAGELFDVLTVAHGVDGRFGGLQLVDAPVTVNDGAAELLLDGFDGFEIFHEGFVEEAVRFGFRGGDDDHLAGEAVTGGVERGALLSDFRDRTGGFLGVLLIGCYLRC